MKRQGLFLSDGTLRGTKWTPKKKGKQTAKPSRGSTHARTRKPPAHAARMADYEGMGRCPMGCESCATKGFTIDCPGLRLVSEANQWEHWRTRNNRKTSQQRAVHWAIISKPDPLRPRPPLHVVITRLAPGCIKDGDNLAGCAKHVVDEVARFLGVDDGDESSVTWSVVQERSSTYGVRIVIRTRTAAMMDAIRDARDVLASGGVVATRKAG